MPPWLWWVFLGIVALAGEAASMALFLLYVGVAAFVAAILAVAGVSIAAQIGVFLALSVVLIVIVRPRMLNALTGRIPVRVLTNQGQITGRTGIVTQTVTADLGQIRLGTAEFWSARAVPPHGPLAPGTPVRVAYLDGLVAYVEPLTDPIALSQETVAAPDAPVSEIRAHKEKQT